MHSQTSLTLNIIWQPQFTQSPSDHPRPNKSWAGKCFGVVKAVPGGQGNVYRVSDGILGSPGVSWVRWSKVRWNKGALICVWDFFPLISMAH